MSLPPQEKGPAAAHALTHGRRPFGAKGAMAPPIRKQFTNQEWNIGFDNVYFSSLYGGCVVDQGYNLLTYIRESKRIDNSGVEYSK